MAIASSGYSQSKQEYYSQANLPFPEEEGARSSELVLLWDVTQSYKLSTLSLAYPMAGDTTRASVKAHWHKPIPEILSWPPHSESAST